MLYNSPCKLEFFSAQSGFVSARLVESSGRTLHLHSLVNPQDESDYFDSVKIWGDKILLLGTGIGYHLLKVVPAFQGKEILVLEYYKECADLCVKEILSGIDNVAVVSSQTGDIESIVNKFKGDKGSVQVIRHPVSYRVNQQFYDPILRMLFTQKKVSQRSGRILVLNGSFFLQDELVRACDAAGFTCSVFNPDQTDGLLAYESQLEMILQKEHIDLVVSVNMLGFDGSGIIGELTSRHGVAVAVWFVDDPRPILLHQKQYIRKNYYAFSWEKTYLPFLKQSGFADAVYLPLATDPDRFSPDGSIYQSVKLGFVGSSMGSTFLDSLKLKYMWRPELDLLVRSVAKKLLADSACNIQRVIRTMCADMSIDYPYTDTRNDTWFQSYIIHTASMMKRKALIERLIPYGIELFGDPEGWHTLLGKQVHCFPDIDYRTELASVYRGTMISVNSTSCQMVTAVNQRVFDIPACGGFVISDNQADIAELFAGDEIVVYESCEELIDKIRYYTEQESERVAISQKARSRVLKEHSVALRLRKIVASVL